LSAEPVVLVATRVPVVRLVAEPVQVAPAEALVLAVRVGPVARVVPVLRVLWVSALWVPRDSSAAPVAPVVRAVPPGPVGFAAMAARAGTAE